jgi:hypothetical protein
MIFLNHAQSLSQGLWYLPQVFDIDTYRGIRRCYRETVTGWQCYYPNRLTSLPNNPHYDYLQRVAQDITMAVGDLVGRRLRPHDQTVFVDLPGHQLTWHFDASNYSVLLQLYCGDISLPGAGTHWYLGENNQELLEQYGTDSIVDIKGLDTHETVYSPNAGYINDNEIKKVHGTRRVIAGQVRESVLFTFYDQ